MATYFVRDGINRYSSSVDVNGGLNISGNGTVRLTNLYINDEISGINGGSLQATNQYIGYRGTGKFSQSGGTNSISGILYLGYDSGSIGTYNLSGGSLSAYNIYIGKNGIGRFEWFYNALATHTLQIGTSSTLAMGFNFDISALSSGTLSRVSPYQVSTLSGLSTANLEITNNATATQSGTSLQIRNLIIGFGTGKGAYQLKSAIRLTASSEYIGHSGMGTFTQTGGTNSNTDSIYLGYNAGAMGTYKMNGGD